MGVLNKITFTCLMRKHMIF